MAKETQAPEADSEETEKSPPEETQAGGDDADAIAGSETDSDSTEPEEQDEMAQGGETEEAAESMSVYDADQMFEQIELSDLDDELLNRYQEIVRNHFNGLRKALSDSKRLPEMDESILASAIEKLANSFHIYNYALEQAARDAKTSRSSRKAG